MPELPEVETIRLGFSRLIVGKVVANAQNYDSPKSFPNATTDVELFLAGATVTQVRRRAKMLLIELSSDYTMMVHLKMTGQLVYIPASIVSSRGSEVSQETSVACDERFGGGHPNDSLVGKLPDNTTRERIDFTDGSRLYFNDLRKFGYMKLVPTGGVPQTDFMQRVGPEPLEEGFTDEVLFARLQRRKNTSIKAAILDQSVLAGVGNIYADESLWMAKIHPQTFVKDLSHAQVAVLRGAIVSVLQLSIDKGGSTDKNYVDAEGKKGSYLKFASVFRLEGQPCPRCGATIEKIRVAGRGTHICSRCQILDKKKIN